MLISYAKFNFFSIISKGFTQISQSKPLTSINSYNKSSSFLEKNDKNHPGQNPKNTFSLEYGNIKYFPISLVLK